MNARRRFLRRSAAALAVSAVPWAAARRVRAQTALEAVRLADGMLAVLGPDANSLAADAGDGVILVDGGHARWSSALLARVEQSFAPKPIAALFNTHWHREQTGANVALGARGVPIVAHENTKLWLGTEVRVRWSGETVPPLPAAGLPTRTFYESGRMRIGARDVEYAYLLNAHTDGDVCVLFPEEDVLVTGGAVSNAGWPIIDSWTGGWLGGMLDAYDTLLSLAGPGTRIVPSVGPILSLAELRAQREMYLTIFDRLESMLRQSYETADVLAARPTAEFDAAWGDPELFVTLAFQSLWGHLRDAYDRRLRNIP